MHCVYVEYCKSQVTFINDMRQEVKILYINMYNSSLVYKMLLNR